MDDWIVEGTSVRKRKPLYRPGVRTQGTSPLPARPSSGKTTNVQARTVTCSRQCFSPSSASRVESRAP
ncbi:hypothetical protein SALBM135S_05911 [Streptomyces alboniger]